MIKYFHVFLDMQQVYKQQTSLKHQKDLTNFPENLHSKSFHAAVCGILDIL